MATAKDGGVSNAAQAEIQTLALDAALAALTRLGKFAKGENERIALAASQELLSRAFGGTLSTPTEGQANSAQPLAIGVLRFGSEGMEPERRAAVSPDVKELEAMARRAWRERGVVILWPDRIKDNRKREQLLKSILTLTVRSTWSLNEMEANTTRLVKLAVASKPNAQRSAMGPCCIAATGRRSTGLVSSNCVTCELICTGSGAGKTPTRTLRLSRLESAQRSDHEDHPYLSSERTSDLGHACPGKD